MTLEEQIGQMLGAGFEGLEPPDYILDWIKTGQVGTIILFGRNVDTPEQLAKLTQTLHDAARTAGRPPLHPGLLLRALRLALPRHWHAHHPTLSHDNRSDASSAEEEANSVNPRKAALWT